MRERDGIPGWQLFAWMAVLLTVVVGVYRLSHTSNEPEWQRVERVDR